MQKAAALLALGVLGTSVLTSSCAEVNAVIKAEEKAEATAGKHQPPAVKVAQVKIAHAPTEKQLAIYYCMQLAKSELGELGELGCEFFGPVPSKKDLQFVFDVDVEAANPSPVPLPLVQLMIAFTAFPDRKAAGGREALGAVCLSLCKDPHNCAQEANACKSTEPEIKDLHSFEAAAANFLVSVALGEKKFDDLKIQTIPAHKTIHFDTRLALDIDQMTKLLGTVAKDAFDAVKHKKTPHLVIPFQVEGSAWVTVESFGRIGASIPPLRDQWDLAKL
jgi:hypothetical protein